MLNLLSGISMAINRRIFGGWLGIPRWIEHVINIACLAPILYFAGLVWWKIIIVVAIIQALYWGQGHGAMYDLGHHGQPDEAMLERYKRQWGYSIACKIFPESMWYKYWFDTFLMFIRYELPSLALIPFTSWWIAFGGVGVTLAYMLGWFLQDKGCKFLGDKLKCLCSSATNFGELAGGFITGALLVL